MNRKHLVTLAAMGVAAMLSAPAMASIVMIIDNDGTLENTTGSVSLPGFNGGGNGYHNNSAWSFGGGNKATYTFTGLAAGMYAIAVSNVWQHSNLAGQPWEVFDNTTSLGSTFMPNMATVDIAVVYPNPYGPSGFNYFKTGAVPTEYAVNSGTLNVVLTATSNFAMADAVRVESVPEPASLGLLGLGALALIRRRR